MHNEILGNFFTMDNKINFQIDRELTDEEKEAVEIAETLQRNDHVAYFAGGAVRDELLGLPSHDIDIATSARPPEIQSIFPKNFEKGKSFGVIAVHRGKDQFEVATFRTDIGIFDHRRPKKVKFASAQADAQRRDFTINGLFFDPIQNQIIDYVGGIKDLKSKTIRFIGDPQERIEEDHLRILRGIRFAAKLGFNIEPKSKEAMAANAAKIGQISKERIRDEMSKILQTKNRRFAIEELEQTGLLKAILPELLEAKNVPQPPEFHQEGDVWEHTLLALENLPENPRSELTWAVLLHDIAKPQTKGYRSVIGKTSLTFFDHDVRSAALAKEILERLHFSKASIDAVEWAISQHMRIINAFRGMSERKQKKLFCDPNIDLLLDLTKADLSASFRPNGRPDMVMYEQALTKRKKFEHETNDDEKQQVKKFDLVTGVDIMQQLSIGPGPEVGRIKTEIEQAYLNGKINNKDEANKMLENYKK